jgi:hypothetical protein
MEHLKFIPDVRGYSATFGTGLVSTDVDGGDPRLRADQLVEPTQFSVSWVFTLQQYEEFSLFFHTSILKGSSPFTVNLISIFGDVELHNAQFIPGSVKLTDATGLRRIVQASILATVDTDYSNMYVIADSIGSLDGIDTWLASLAELVNVNTQGGLGV